jgi:hypothetical protein
MSELPVAFETNATRDPSGDNDEWPITSLGIAVICLGAERPVSSHVHRFRLPLVGLLKRSVRPSRDTNVHIGSRAASINLIAARPLASGTSPSGTFHASRS